jgi:hypothetical protein
VIATHKPGTWASTVALGRRLDHSLHRLPPLEAKDRVGEDRQPAQEPHCVSIRRQVAGGLGTHAKTLEHFFTLRVREAERSMPIPDHWNRSHAVCVDSSLDSSAFRLSDTQGEEVFKRLCVSMPIPPMNEAILRGQSCGGRGQGRTSQSRCIPRGPWTFR